MTTKYKIYVFYTGVYCKIGVTSRPIEQRLKEVQTHCPLPIYKYMEIGTLSKATAFYVETKIKEHLSHHNTFGEWYKEFPGIHKSVTFLIKTHSSEKYATRTASTEHQKFEDVSIQIFLKIQKYRKDHDLHLLSKLYTNMILEKHLQEDGRFVAYTKESLINILESAIGIVLAYFRNGGQTVPEETKKSLESNYHHLRETNSNFRYSIANQLSIHEHVEAMKKKNAKRKKIKKVNLSDSTMAVLNRIGNEQPCDGTA